MLNIYQSIKTKFACTVLTFTTGLSFAGCAKASSNEKQTSESDTPTESIVQPTETTVESSESSTEVTTTEESTVVTIHNDYGEDILPTVSHPYYRSMLSNDDLAKLYYFLFPIYTFGYDNPFVGNVIHDIFDDDTLTIDDLNFFQDDRLIFASEGFCFLDSTDVAFEDLLIQRYICNSLEIPFMQAEIPYSFFEINFSDILSIWEKADPEDNVQFNALFPNVKERHWMNPITQCPYDINSKEYRDSMLIMFFTAAINYNIKFYYSSYNFSGKGGIKLARAYNENADDHKGRIVHVPTKTQMQKLIDFYLTYDPNYVIDFTQVESKDSLEKSLETIGLSISDIDYAAEASEIAF